MDDLTSVGQSHCSMAVLKGIVSVNSYDTSCYDGKARFTMVRLCDLVGPLVLILSTVQAR